MWGEVRWVGGVIMGQNFFFSFFDSNEVIKPTEGHCR